MDAQMGNKRGVTLPAVSTPKAEGAWSSIGSLRGAVLGLDLIDLSQGLLANIANPSLQAAVLGTWQTFAASYGSSRSVVEGVVIGGGMVGLKAVDAIATVKSEQAQVGSAWPKVIKLLSRAVTHDTESLWRAVQLGLQEETAAELVHQQFSEFLERYGENGLRALGGIILGRLPSSEASWSLLRMIGNAEHIETRRARRDILAAALDSRDAGLRYAAASALGELGGEVATNSLRKRLIWEGNDSVRRMINAELSG
jgi:HEAT repeat protein